MSDSIQIYQPLIIVHFSISDNHIFDHIYLNVLVFVRLLIIKYQITLWYKNIKIYSDIPKTLKQQNAI